MTVKPIHRCKPHGEPYTVCPTCGCEYCERTWPVCPRGSWHPSHGTTAQQIADRYTALAEARRQNIRNL